MKCQQCQREVLEGAFCPHCGERLERAQRAAEQVAKAEPPTAAVDRLQPGVRRGGKQPPEVELWSDSYSPKALLGPFIAVDAVVFGAAVGIAMFANMAGGWLALGIGCVVLYGGLGLILAYQRLSLRYRLTTYRFFHERGLLSRVIDRIEMIDIDDVTVYQGIVERMIGIGTIVVESSDRTHPTLRLRGIDNVKHVANLIDDARRAERQRRGIHIESI